MTRGSGWIKGRLMMKGWSLLVVRGHVSHTLQRTLPLCRLRLDTVPRPPQVLGPPTRTPPDNTSVVAPKAVGPGPRHMLTKEAPPPALTRTRPLSSLPHHHEMIVPALTSLWRGGVSLPYQRGERGYPGTGLRNNNKWRSSDIR